MLTQKYINDIAYKIVGCAIEVHKYHGPGLLINFNCENIISDGLIPLVTDKFSKSPKF